MYRRNNIFYLLLADVVLFDYFKSYIFASNLFISKNYQSSQT